MLAADFGGSVREMYAGADGHPDPGAEQSEGWPSFDSFNRSIIPSFLLVSSNVDLKA